MATRMQGEIKSLYFSPPASLETQRHRGVPMQRDRRAVAGTVEIRFRPPSLRFRAYPSNSWQGVVKHRFARSESPVSPRRRRWDLPDRAISPYQVETLSSLVRLFLCASVSRTTEGSGWLTLPFRTGAVEVRFRASRLGLRITSRCTVSGYIPEMTVNTSLPRGSNFNTLIFLIYGYS
jgi:hypothetical protein